MSKRGLAAATSMDEGFLRFWAAYPRRVGRLDALKAWTHLQPSPEQIESMLIALAWQCQQPAWIQGGGKYVPYPASWIRGGRWDDEPFDTRPILTGERSGGGILLECPHTPPCPSRWFCGQKQLAEGL